MNTIDTRQIIHALERAERRLRHAADALMRKGDYDAQFPAEDAERMREAITLLRQPSVVLGEVSAERERQDRKWGGPKADDARKAPLNWVNDIVAYATWAGQMANMGAGGKYRRRLLQVAALAVAACESYDRGANGFKPMSATQSLAEQVADAQREVASWPEERRRNVQLEGGGPTT